MNLQEAFQQAILTDPRDDGPWQMYADWLDERGDPLAAVYRVRRFTNAVGMEFVLIPAGTFQMGAEGDEGLPAADARPRHSVTIPRPFYLSATPMTWKQLALIRDVGYPGLVRWQALRAAAYPAVGVSHAEAFTVCQALSATPAEQEAGRRYRLPTEAEWEHACRAGTTSRYHTGPELHANEATFFAHAPLQPGDRFAGNGERVRLYALARELEADWTQVAGFCRQLGLAARSQVALLSVAEAEEVARLYLRDNPLPPLPVHSRRFEAEVIRTAPVRSHPPNGFGLYDMHGNVWEWCADWYAMDYYAESPAVGPAGPPTGRQRVVRGGSWAVDRYYCRSASRNKCYPEDRDDSIGFRPVCVVSAPGEPAGPAHGPS